MAIDSENKRRAAIGVLPVPNNDIGDKDRRHAIGHYRYFVDTSATPAVDGDLPFAYLLEVRDSSDDLVCVLENAFGIGYTERVNSIASLDFSIPADDSKVSNLTVLNEVWLRNYQTQGLVKKFKIQRRKDNDQLDKLITMIECEDITVQLSKEVVIDYSVTDRAVAIGASSSVGILEDLLDFQVSNYPISVGIVDDSIRYLILNTPRTRSITVSNESIWKSILRLRATYGGYMYVLEDRYLYWRDSIGEDKGQQIRINKNMRGIETDIDYSRLYNRIYAEGGTIGGNRVKLAVGVSNLPYVESAASQATYGDIFPISITNPTITNADDLEDWANEFLDAHKDPPITYTIPMVDIWESDHANFSFDQFMLGSTVTVINESLSISSELQIVEIRHADLLNPLDMIAVCSRLRETAASLVAKMLDTPHLNQNEDNNFIHGAEAGEELPEFRATYRAADGLWYLGDKGTEVKTNSKMGVTLKDMAEGDQATLITRGRINKTVAGDDGEIIWLSTGGGMTTDFPGSGEFTRILGNVFDGKVWINIVDGHYMELS